MCDVLTLLFKLRIMLFLKMILVHKKCIVIEDDDVIVICIDIMCVKLNMI